MTRDELTIGIMLGYEGENFEDLPAEHLDKELISFWLMHGAYGDFTKIPKHLVDDDLRRQAVSMRHDSLAVRDYPLGAIMMDETACYEELVLLAIKQCEMNMTHVDRALYSEALFLKALEVNSRALITFLTGSQYKGRIEWTEAMIDSAVSKDVQYLKYLPKERIKRESLERLVTEGTECATDLEKAGLLDIMSDVMRGGYWPRLMKKPSSLKEALYLMLDVHHSAENVKVSYKAFVRSHPAQEVLPLMKSPEMQVLMLEIYSTDELMPHLRTGLLKGAPRVRGKLLENGLGL